MDDPRITMEGWGDAEVVKEGSTFATSVVLSSTSDLIRENKGGGGGGGGGNAKKHLFKYIILHTLIHHFTHTLYIQQSLSNRRKW